MTEYTQEKAVIDTFYDFLLTLNDKEKESLAQALNWDREATRDDA